MQRSRDSDRSSLLWLYALLVSEAEARAAGGTAGKVAPGRGGGSLCAVGVLPGWSRFQPPEGDKGEKGHKDMHSLGVDGARLGIVALN